MSSIIAQSQYETERNKPMPSLNHGSIQSNLLFELAPYRKKFRIVTELSLGLSEWESVPDIAIYPALDIDMKKDVIRMTAPPLCAIEILSPTQNLTELTTKADNYFKYGVKSCWIVLPSLSSIYVFSSPDNFAVFKSSEDLRDGVLGINIPLFEVFA